MFDGKWPEWDARELKRIRVNTGLSQRNFCKFFGVPLKILQAWERDILKPDSATCLMYSLIKCQYYAFADVIIDARRDIDRRIENGSVKAPDQVEAGI